MGSNHRHPLYKSGALPLSYGRAMAGKTTAPPAHRLSEVLAGRSTSKLRAPPIFRRNYTSPYHT